MNLRLLDKMRGVPAILVLAMAGAGCTSNSPTDAGMTPDVPMDVVMDTTPVDVPPPDVFRRCTSNTDCAGNPAGTVCDTTSGLCVGCATTPDTCMPTQFCDPVALRCAMGCSRDEGCTMGQHCDTAQHTCVACTTDAHCPAGNLCRGGTCVMGCSTGTMCPTGSSCCNGGCVNTQTNIADCGMCGNLCRAPNGVAACTDGACAVGSCTAPYANCDMMVANGCETNTQTDAAHCGMCGNACPTRPNSTAACTAGACGFTCATGFADCDGMPDNGCEVDIRASAGNCGACSRLCNPANAMGTCTDGACRVGGCNPGFADCDMDTATGCETPTATNPANCGGCGTVCPTRDHSVATCAMGVCGLRCADGFANCDGDPANGCEVDTRTDLGNCGRCGARCAPTGGVAVCSAGVCGVTACATGFGDCDGDPSNGCETDVRSNTTHCGMCRNACIAGPSSTTTCTDSACRLACSAGFGDCDSNPLNGCEVNTNVSPTHCGTCGRACATGQVCEAGTCQTPCPGVQTRCGGTCVDTSTSITNCGACGTTCGTGSTCQGGVCVCRLTGTPTTDPYNGIVCGTTCVDALNSTTNCGACGNVCPTGNTCVRGTCRCALTGGGLGVTCGSTCVDTVTNTSNCGRCGNACAGSESCIFGVCRCVTSSGGSGTTCSGVCSDPQTDRNNCGSCGHACRTDQACVAGVCACATGFATCSGVCTDLGTATNCGACGRACATGESCLGGSCINLGRGTFRIDSLTATACSLIEHNTATGDDRGGIAVSTTNAYYTGDAATGRFALANVSGGTSTGVQHDGLTGDLSTQRPVVLLNASGAEPSAFSISATTPFVVTQIGLLDPATGLLTSTRITLSRSISMAYNSGIFGGFGRILLHTGDAQASQPSQWFAIDLTSGAVSALRAAPTPTHTVCESWAFWGTSENFGGELYADYVEGSTRIVRYRISDGTITTLASFTSLSDMCSFTFSISNSRWYWHHEGGSQFGGSDESIGFCNATFSTP